MGYRNKGFRIKDQNHLVRRDFSVCLSVHPFVQLPNHQVYAKSLSVTNVVFIFILSGDSKEKVIKKKDEYFEERVIKQEIIIKQMVEEVSFSVSFN